jgi:hypothetical protein
MLLIAGDFMLKLTLSHIGAVSLGRLLAIWSFVIGVIALVVYGLISMLLAILGMAAGTDVVQTLLALVITLVMGVVGLVAVAIGMFIFGFISAVVYNVILGVGGGIDFDYKERK